MPDTNIIRKQVLSLNFNTGVPAPFALQPQAMKWCHEVLLPLIEQALEPFAQDATIIRLDCIEVDLQTTDNPFTPLLAEKIAAEVVQQIRESGTKTGIAPRLLTREQSFEEAFIFFLRHGYLPWWCTGQSHAAFQQNSRLLANSISDTGRRLLLQLLKDEMVARRFVMTPPDDVLSPLLAAITQQDAATCRGILEYINAIANLVQNPDRKQQFLLHLKTGYVGSLAGVLNEGAALLWALKGQKVKSPQQEEAISSLVHSWVDRYQIPIERLQKLLDEAPNFKLTGTNNRIIKDEEQLVQSRNTELDRGKTQRRHEEGFFITNAGLVLAAPFLPRFFTNLGIVADGAFNNKDLPVALLQWLVTGSEFYAEFDTVLAKVFCGMEPEAPIIIVPQLPDGFKREAHLLLEAIIGHWPALKNTSVEGLREAFLQRGGKLSMQGGEWLLQVEQKAYDMLLNDLPWTIHTIKLPWMERLMRTEWV